LPDGRRFLYFDMASDANIQGIYIGSLDGAEPKNVVLAETQAVYAAPDHLLLVSQDVLVARRFDATTGTIGDEIVSVARPVGSDPAMYRAAFSVSDTGVLAHRVGGAVERSLVWVDGDGDALGELLRPDVSGISNPQLAPDGRRAIVTRVANTNADLWLIDVSRGTTSRFSSDPRIDTNAVWSPDGSRVAFASSRNGRFDLFEKPASSATDERPLLVTDQDKSTMDWSPDGKTLLYAVQDSKNGSDLWALPLEGASEPFAVVQSAFDDVQGQFSPDGHWVAYSSNETGRYQVYVKPFAGPGGRVQASTAGGAYPRWRRDGQELFYVAADGQMMAVPIGVTSRADALEAEAGAPRALFQTRLATGGSIFAGGFRSRAQYAVSADGRFLLNAAADEGTALPITVVLNWDASLEP
jgi:dipeptidyl aminopeptidase/acylaminoacyl peptidase